MNQVYFAPNQRQSLNHNQIYLSTKIKFLTIKRMLNVSISILTVINCDSLIFGQKSQILCINKKL